VIVDNLERHIGHSIEPLSVEIMREELSLHFEKLNVTDEDKENKEEHALVGASFTGKCYNCSKIGHKANECRMPKKKTNGPRRPFQGVCYNCGKKGHRSSECRAPKKRTESETAGVTVDEEEVCLIAHEVWLEKENWKKRNEKKLAEKNEYKKFNKLLQRVTKEKKSLKMKKMKSAWFKYAKKQLNNIGLLTVDLVTERLGNLHKDLRKNMKG